VGKKRIWLAAVAGLAIAAVAAYPSVPRAAAATRGEDWIVNQHALALLAGAGLSQHSRQELFGNTGTYLVESADGTDEGVTGAAATATFTSYTTLRATLADGGLPRGTKAVLFDDEHWSLTPSVEQLHPAEYEELAAALVHAHHLLFVTAPATDLTEVLAPGDSDHYAAYIKLGLAASAARYANVVDIQAQGAELDLAKYASFVEQAAAQARKANSRVVVLAGISTNPSGQHVTSAEFTAAFKAARPYVAGFWLNIPQAGTACPACGTPQPKAAIPLLESLLRLHLGSLGAALPVGEELLELRGDLVGGGHRLTLGEQALGLVSLGRVVLLLEGPDQVGDLARFLHLSSDEHVGAIGGLAQAVIRQVKPGRIDDRLLQGERAPRVNGLRQVVRHLHREPDRVHARLAEAELDQR
jgi:hypothetical protein